MELPKTQDKKETKNGRRLGRPLKNNNNEKENKTTITIKQYNDLKTQFDYLDYQYKIALTQIGSLNEAMKLRQEHNRKECYLLSEEIAKVTKERDTLAKTVELLEEKHKRLMMSTRR